MTIVAINSHPLFNLSLTSVRISAINTYDLHNQLTKTIAEDGIEVNNTYNAEGYRVGKEVNGEQTCYLYEADKVILEVDEAGNQIARNVYGTNLLLRTVEAKPTIKCTMDMPM